MTIQSLKEAGRLLVTRPVLWIPGLAAGLLGAGLWILFNLMGLFFASRLVILSLLILLVFVTGIYVAIRQDTGDVRVMLKGGVQYYFRALLPQLFVIFAVSLVFIILLVTASIAGDSPDAGIITLVACCTMLPTVFMTFFCDTAAVFEDRRVFDSIRRSIDLAITRMGEVLTFYIISALIFACISFFCMVIWEAFLYDRLAPLASYNQSQIANFTPQQLLSLIGPGGMGITAVAIFICAFFTVPVLATYKACFFRHLSKTIVPITQVTGEYDSKGRWYKY